MSHRKREKKWDLRAAGSLRRFMRIHRDTIRRTFNQKEGDATCHTQPDALVTPAQLRDSSDAAPTFNPLVAAVGGRSIGRGPENVCAALSKQNSSSPEGESNSERELSPAILKQEE